MDDVRQEMEEGEISSGSEEADTLGQYIPLERPVNPKPHFQPKSVAEDYDSDSDPPCPLPLAAGSDSDSEDEKPAAKAPKPGGPWGRRGALVVEDGGGETFQMMAQAYQASREQKGLNKKRKNNVWGSIVQEESIADSIAEFGVGRQLKELCSDRGAETYDFTLIAKERQEERRRQRLAVKEAGSREEAQLDLEMDTYWAKKAEESDKEDSKEGSEERLLEEEVEAMQEDSVDASKRGTKRSIKDRLGDKKVKMDRFRNETLPPPGKPRQIVDIAEISLVEGTDEEFGEEVALRLKEEKEEMMISLVKSVGRKVVWDFFKETQRIEGEGGMVINNGARRRTPGGVLLHLLRKTEDTSIKEKVRKFFNNSHKDDRRRILEAKKRKQKDFDKEMSDFLSARRKLVDKKDQEVNMEEEEESELNPRAESEEKEEEELVPLPNVLSMIASSMGEEARKQKSETKKCSVTRVSSFKEPEAPPNSVERPERLSPVSKEERELLDYDDDFLTSTNESEDIELF